MLSFGRRLLLLLLLFVAGISLAGLIGSLVARISPSEVAALRVGAVMQDLFGFVLPAVILSLMVSRLPANFLQINRFSGKHTLLAIVTVAAAVPLVNNIAAWNAAANFGPLQPALVQAEQMAAEISATMLGTSGSVTDLVMGLLIVGVLAGLSEELFFRGALQRLLLTRPMNPHAAIWLTALVFSLFHMQFFGFVPRLLLGALFGYAAWWSGSLWTAVAAHIFNNSLAVTVMWFINRGALPQSAESFGTGSAWWLSLSLVAAALLVWRMRVNRTACDGK